MQPHQLPPSRHLYKSDIRSLRDFGCLWLIFRCAADGFPRFDSRSRGDATRTGVESPVLFQRSPCRLAPSGRIWADLKCLTRAVINQNGCEDARHDDRTHAETCQVLGVARLAGFPLSIRVRAATRPARGSNPPCYSCKVHADSHHQDEPPNIQHRGFQSLVRRKPTSPSTQGFPFQFAGGFKPLLCDLLHIDKCFLVSRTVPICLRRVWMMSRSASVSQMSAYVVLVLH